MAKRRLLVEGWRGIPHSYAVVNQWQLLELATRGDVTVRVRDMPFHDSGWHPSPGLFDPDQARILGAFQPPEAGFVPEATLRMAYPHDLTAAPKGRTIVFGTSEMQVVFAKQLCGRDHLRALAAREDWTLITPSRWSAAGFSKLGLRADQVAVVPHGVNTMLFQPGAARRPATREHLGLTGFVFFNAGAMSWNKNIDGLLKAFAVVAEKRADVRLLLKGDDKLYASRDILGKTLEGLTSRQRALIEERVIYTGNSLPMETMAELYRAVDCYVSPYRAEGFNMPVLEAAASGLPVICTDGGATDDFVTDRFARRVAAARRQFEHEGEVATYLEADLEHLVHLMLTVVDDHPWRAAAGQAGPAHARGFTWAAIVDRLFATAFPPPRN